MKPAPPVTRARIRPVPDAWRRRPSSPWSTVAPAPTTLVLRTIAPAPTCAPGPMIESMTSAPVTDDRARHDHRVAHPGAGAEHDAVADTERSTLARATSAPGCTPSHGCATHAVEQVELGLRGSRAACRRRSSSVAGPGVERAGRRPWPGRSRARSRRAARGDAVEHRRLEHVGAGVDQVGRRLARRRLLDERARPGRRSSVGTTPNADGSSTGCSAIGGLGARRASWTGDERRDVEVGEHVAVDDHERARRCRASRAAKRMAPAVSSGSGSTA